MRSKLKARLMSLALSVIMVATMMPTTALATEGGNETLGVSAVATVQSFDTLGDRFIPSVGEAASPNVYSLPVALGTPEEELNLPDELTAMVARAAAPESESIPVQWTSDKEYKSDANDRFIYTAKLPEGYVLSDGVELPQIYVMVGRQARAATTRGSFSGDGYSYENGLLTITSPDGWDSATERLNVQLTTVQEVIVAPGADTKIPDEIFTGACYDQTLRKVTIGEGVLTMGERVFMTCTALTEVSLPSTLTSIGAEAFKSARNLEALSIPNSVTAIGSNAFEACSSLVSINLPESLEEISSGVFSRCNKLTAIDIPNTVRKIDSEAFSGTGLQTVSLPESLTILGSGVFKLCTSLTTVRFSSQVAEIPPDMFSNCSALTSVNLPEGITTIGRNAFSRCEALPSIMLPATLTKIEDGAFSYCEALPSIMLPATLTKIEDSAFSYCKKLKEITLLVAGRPNIQLGRNVFSSMPNDFKIFVRKEWVDILRTTWSTYKDHIEPRDLGYTYANGTLIITKDVGFASVQADVMAALLNPSNVTSIIIKSNVSAVPDEALHLQDSAFSSAVSVTIEDGVTGIGNNAFQGFSALSAVTIPSSVTSIGDGAFSGCSTLSSITMSAEQPCTLGADAFAGLPTDFKIYVPSTAVDDYKAAAGWVNYESHIMGGDPGYSFTDGTLIITKDRGFASVQADVMAERLNPSNVTSIIIKSNVSAVPNEAFHFDTYTFQSAVSVTIEDGVTGIGNNAFQGFSALSAVTIPSSITSIGDGAFSGCSTLSSITMSAVQPCTLGADAFAGLPTDFKIYVPNDTADIYKAAAGWLTYRDHIVGGTVPTPPSDNSSSGSTTPSNTIDTAEGNKGATNVVSTAIAAGTGNTITTRATFSNYGYLGMDGLKAINEIVAKESAGKTVNFKVNFDEGPVSRVNSRITVNPLQLAKATADWKSTDKLPLGVFYDQQKDSRVLSVNNLFTKAFNNKIVSVVFEQRSSLAVTAEFCAKLNLANTFGQDKQLYFYTYNNETNIYNRITAPGYWVDKNGYAHINAPLGGSIIITDKPLTKR